MEAEFSYGTMPNSRRRFEIAAGFSVVLLRAMLTSISTRAALYAIATSRGWGDKEASSNVFLAKEAKKPAALSHAWLT
jgi:hypothetical protein